MEQKPVNLKALVEELLLRVMGSALDFARISEMSDRSLAQFTRSIKDLTHKTIEDGTRILQEHNLIKPEDKDGSPEDRSI